MSQTLLELEEERKTFSCIFKIGIARIYSNLIMLEQFINKTFCQVIDKKVY